MNVDAQQRSHVAYGRIAAGLLVLVAAVAFDARCLRAQAGEAIARPADPDVPPAGFVALFNGRDLDGWFGRKTEDPRALQRMKPAARAAHRAKTRIALRKHWRVEDGVLVNDGDGPYATTDRDYGDFELRLEYKTVAGADSGIYLRGCPQVQIWDTTKAGGKWHLGADKGSGGLWNNAKGAPGKDPSRHADKPFGEWNTVRVVMIGERVSVWLNGVSVVDDAVMENYFDRSRPIFARGPIQLQTHGGEIRWRRVFLREIPPAEADAYRRARDGDGFRALVNGRDLAGWRNTADYSIAGDRLVCGPKGKTMFTDASFANYTLRFRYKLPPGANNGLAIHYPGTGNAAYAGIELQILDNAAPQYATLRPWQYHGSAYGIKAAHRGYQRPAGEWNDQRVTVRDSRVTVDLNGYRILDLDLANTAPADGRPHPGMKRRAGHIGFFGHGHRVEFRLIEVRTHD